MEDGAQSSHHHQSPRSNERIIWASGAQNATADDWIALMEEEERKEKQKSKKQKRAGLREEQLHNRKKLSCCTAYYKSEGATMHDTVPA